MKRTQSNSHVLLTSHPDQIFNEMIPIHWGENDPIKRGPIIATLTDRMARNAIGTHSGAYSVYRALALASGALPPDHKADLRNTNPVEQIGPFPSWGNREKIVSLDPWGAQVATVFSDFLANGYDIRPTIAITKAHIKMPELTEALELGRLKIDNNIITPDGDVVVTKIAIEPVWHLPGIAARFGIEEADLRRALFQETGGIFPELITRSDLKTVLPPIGGTTVYIFGTLDNLGKHDAEITVRIHDECNGSDVFGSDICTCRPYLVHGIEESIKTAQTGGTGLIVYFRKEGRALGEVTKFLVYNARKRQEGGDSAATYFHRTECVAGVQDMRFQELMPDVLHWLGISRITNLVSMSDMKYDAIVKSGIEVVTRVSIPDGMIPKDAQVEMEAKKAAGYYTEGKKQDAEALAQVKGRGLNE